MTDKKEIIRKAAIKVMSKKGFYNTKTSEVAEKANVAVGTIYNYFKNKEDILDYIFRYELEKRMKNLKKIKQKDLDFWEKIESFLQFHFKEVKENMALGQILVREKKFPEKEGSDSINKYLTLIPEIMENEIKAAIKRGEINEAYDPEINANIIFGAIQGIVEKAIKKEDKSMLANAPEELVRLLRNGLIK